MTPRVRSLSARNPPGLVGVVSVSGGLQSESNCPISDILVDAYKNFGTKNRVPNLWIYSRNDKVFGPDLAERFHTAFLDAGGDVHRCAEPLDPWEVGGAALARCKRCLGTFVPRAAIDAAMWLPPDAGAPPPNPLVGVARWVRRILGGD